MTDMTPKQVAKILKRDGGTIVLEPSREQICREFHEACGGHWHEVDQNIFGFEYCECFIESGGDVVDFTNPQYLHPDEVLSMMRGRKDWTAFWVSIVPIEPSHFLEPDKLLKAAHKWVMERKRDDRT